jgi:protein-export membrane protein SecD
MVQIPKWQVFSIVALLVVGLLFAAPNLLDRGAAEEQATWLPQKQINLGLDLRGGSHLLIEADVDSALDERLASLGDALSAALSAAGIGHGASKITGSELRLGLRDAVAPDQVRAIVGELSDGVSVSTPGGAELRLAFTEQAERDLRNDVMEQVAAVIRVRLDALGTKELSLQRQGEDRIVVQVPGVEDPEPIKEILSRIAKLTFSFVVEGVVAGVDRVPPNAKLLPSDDIGADGRPIYHVVQKRKILGGENLVDAQATFQDNRPVVSFRFDSAGAKRFAEATRDNFGRPFAIVLDGKVISAPVIREPILGGSGVITGRFTVKEVQELALLLRAGALSAPIEFLEERSVGPGLGADSIRAGEIASLLGLAFVVVFMVLGYGTFGLIADIALVANLVLIVAALSALQATLTLPGLAGIVLTIGIAVDANVLIFERIREELSLGRGPVTAIDAGYRRAMTTILDSNLTTLIAAVLLFYFGSGPVKGFAVTLSIGIITSMFTAIMVTRLLLITWLRRARPQKLPI